MLVARTSARLPYAPQLLPLPGAGTWKSGHPQTHVAAVLASCILLLLLLALTPKATDVVGGQKWLLG
jgi:hypothetical protein